MSRFTESGPDEENVTGVYEEQTEIMEQMQSVLSGAATQGSLPSLTLEATFEQWQKIWDALNGNPPLAQVRLTVNGTPVLYGLAISRPGLTKPCRPQTLSGNAGNV